MRIRSGVSLFLGCLALLACGHTDEEMAAKQAELDRAHALLAEASHEIDREKLQMSEEQAALDLLKNDVLRHLAAWQSDTARQASESADDRARERVNADKEKCDCR